MIFKGPSSSLWSPLSLIPQIILLNIVAYAWFNNGVYNTWMEIDKTSLSTFDIKPAPSPSSSSNTLETYALIAAATHSMALIGGQSLCGLLNTKLKLTLPGSRATFALISVVGCFLLLQYFFYHQFESKSGIIYEQASLFFYDHPNSSWTFSLFSSCSYLIWLLAGVLVRSSSSVHVGIFPSWLHTNIYKLSLMLLLSFAVFHILVFPLWFQLVKPMMKGGLTEDNFTHEFSGLATLTHTVALSIGMLFTRTGRDLSSIFCALPSMREVVASPFVAGVTAMYFLGWVIVPEMGEIITWMSIQLYNHLALEVTQFAGTVESLISGGNLFSASVMIIFYLGLISLGVAGLLVARRIQEVTFTQTSDPSPSERPTGTIVTPNILSANRANSYQNVATKDPAVGALHAMLWLSVLSFFGSPAGVFCLYGILHICSGFTPISTVLEKPILTFLESTLITASGSIATFIPFARSWDKFYEQYPQFRCQQDKSHDVSGLNRLEVGLAVMNLLQAAALSSLVAVVHLLYPGVDKIYFDNPISTLQSFAYLLASTVAFFIWIDLWAYVAHRALHLPWMYKNIHKLHHKWKQTTAFTALALHPLEFLLLNGGVYIGLYTIPMHPAAITVNLLYIHFHNVVDHSGVYVESTLPWQPSSLFHDDHHRMFHLNYGQSLTCWDKWGGTFYAEKKRYTESTFSH